MKISNAKGRTDGNSGYTRVLGNSELGQLLSRVQATVISNGNELERMVLERSKTIDDLGIFISEAEQGNIDDGVYVCTKKILKKAVSQKQFRTENIEPDLLVFLVQKRRVCKVIELKDGDSFDTKKSKGERENLEKFAILFGSQIPFTTEFYVCCFNQNNKDTIYEGFKKQFELSHILTGREFCDILGIDYDEIINLRRADEKINIRYFLEEMLKIEEVKDIVLDILDK